MALWMEASSTPITEQQQADLDAISALRESATIELKEKGNEYVKMGKKHYADAIDCYTRAINQKISNNVENSILFANRAHVNLLLGNYRRALTDAEEAIKFNSANIKAYYRGAKAALALDLLPEAGRLCRCGLEQSPFNEELKKLETHVNTKKAEIDKREHQASEALSTTEALVSALENRNLKLGRAMYKDLTGVRKPRLDKSGILHWPVLLLYGEVMSSDFIEDFCEHDMFSAHLDMLFAGDSPPLPWDENHAYTREAVELYYQSNAGHALPKRKVFQYFLEDTAGAVVKSFDEQEADDKDMDANFASKSDKAPSRWMKVNERKTLLDVLKQRGYVIPGIPGHCNQTIFYFAFPIVWLQFFIWYHADQVSMKNLCQGTGLLLSNVVKLLYWYHADGASGYMLAYSFSSLIGYNQPHQYEALHLANFF